VHHNRSTMVNVSFAFGKSWRFNSFQTDFYLGSALNSIVHHRGRALHNDSIIDFNGPSNSLIKNQGKIDGMLGVRFHYFLNRHIGITSAFHMQKSLMNWSIEDGVNYAPVSYGLLLGLSYSL
jgi:hypothetical protein